MTRILGISAFHADASAAAVADGRFVAGVEEERFRRIKHWAGFPEQALRFCLGELGGRMEDVSALAVSRQPRAYLLRKALLALSHPRSPAPRGRPRAQPGPGAVAGGAGRRRLRTLAASPFRRAPPGPRGLGLLLLAVRGGDVPDGRRLRRFRLPDDGRGPRQLGRGPRSGPLPPLAGALLHGGHPVPRASPASATSTR